MHGQPIVALIAGGCAYHVPDRRDLTAVRHKRENVVDPLDAETEVG
jgi:hypothetical protein